LLEPASNHEINGALLSTDSDLRLVTEMTVATAPQAAGWADA